VSPGQAVREALKDSDAVKAIAGERVFPSRLPPNITLPSVVYTVVSSMPEAAFDTPESDSIKQTRVQIDSYAKDYDKAHELAEAIAKFLSELDDQDLRVSFADSRDLFENDTMLHRVSADFWVWSA
jgi:hypothetical protein